MDRKITLLQAYKAMYRFLQDYYYRGKKSDELGLLLTGMELVDSGNTADPAYWNDWLNAVNKVINNDVTKT